MNYPRSVTDTFDPATLAAITSAPARAKPDYGTPLVELRGIVKTYRLGDITVEALRGIDLTVNWGEFAAVWGPSGSGKSTLLNVIGLIDTPTSGDIILAGQPVGTLNDRERTRLRHQNIGFIFQSFNLVPVLSALENVMLPLQIRGVANSKTRARAHALLDEVGLADKARSRPDQLSGGQRQRVAIARALAGDPRFVIADEPTANLDSENSRRVIDLMLDLNLKTGTTFLISTHDPRVTDHVDRRITISDGELTGVESHSVRGGR